MKNSVMPKERARGKVNVLSFDYESMVGLTVWLAVAFIILIIFLMASELVFLAKYPDAWVLPVADVISSAADWFTATFRTYFRALSGVLAIPLGWLRDVLQWLPWPATIIATTALAYAVGRWKLALGTCLGLLYVVFSGYWIECMYTLAVIGAAIPFSTLVGLFLGILAHRSPGARTLIEPILDFMQTIPSFVYLIPLLILFGLGPVVGMMAAAIYAIPPMARNVLLGLERVPRELVEAATMSGSTKRQTLWWVQLPSAMPYILMGVNQSIMANLGMVVIAAIVGGFPDIGLEVFTTMRKAQFGQSVAAGVVIAIIAIILDRLTRALAAQKMNAQLQPEKSKKTSYALRIALAALVIVPLVNKWIFGGAPLLKLGVINIAAPLDNGVVWIIQNYFDSFQLVKSWILYYFMRPLENGFLQSVHPQTWGFSINFVSIFGYVAISVALIAIAWFRVGWKLAVSVALISIIYFFGLLEIPWTAFLLIVTSIAWQVGNWRHAVFTALSLLFIAATGNWDPAMHTVQICSAAVTIAFLLGVLVGILGAEFDVVSAFLRPINDTIQTMPIFVFLIPAVMVFLVGDFTALVAIVFYAVVPTVRYTEYGLRNVPEQTIEAARAMGVTRTQMLFHIKLPLALPEIMLGLNQTIMMALAMVVVAAYVGARGLGQVIMGALGDLDIGSGVVAGVAISLIAIVADRTIQLWSARKKRSLGLESSS